ncbi:porin [Azohydromonas aeria]|uniref:porin n=1 Tax=Azohydromonas aeria TaxID=2590212 RepID=UPI0012F8C889|nr:porin [Azohydromonas aeria]
MNKNCITAAALAACAGAACAQSNVTLYGIADAYVESARISGKGSTAKVSNGGMQPSRWGLRGVEDLGDGLKAGFVLESGISIDTGTSLQGGRLFGRQAYVSLSSPAAGEVRLGRQYAPIHYSMVFSDVDPFSAFSPVLAMYVSNGDQSRQDNQVSYWTPSLGGFSAAVAVAAGENAATAPSVPTPWVAAGTMKRNVGGLLRYQGGGLDASLAYHQGGQATAAGDADQKSYNIGAIYNVSGYAVGGNFWEHRNELVGGATPKTRGLALGVKVPIGTAWSAVAQVARVEDNGQAYATGAAKAEGRNTYLNVGLNYRLSKRTDVYLRYARIEDDNGGYNGRATTALYGIFGPGNTLPAGGSASSLALGVRHAF